MVWRRQATLSIWDYIETKLDKQGFNFYCTLMAAIKGHVRVLLLQLVTFCLVDIPWHYVQLYQRDYNECYRKSARYLIQKYLQESTYLINNSMRPSKVRSRKLKFSHVMLYNKLHTQIKWLDHTDPAQPLHL